jgi:hypothetical protein
MDGLTIITADGLAMAFAIAFAVALFVGAVVFAAHTVANSFDDVARRNAEPSDFRPTSGFGYGGTGDD